MEEGSRQGIGANPCGPTLGFCLGLAGVYKTMCLGKNLGMPSPSPTAIRMLALGDSLTQGVGDPRPGRSGFGGALDGWVMHLANALGGSERRVNIHNLAFAGAQSFHVVDDQLPAIRGQTADLASCFVGVNDLCRTSFDEAEYGQAMEQIFGALIIAAPLVITATIHPFDARYPLPGSLRAKVRAHTAEANAVLRELAERFGLLLLDLERRPEMQRSDIWAVDRLHPNRYGHQLIAAEVLRLLQNAGHFTKTTMTPPTPTGRGTSDLAHVVWTGSYVQRVVTARVREHLSTR